MKIMIVSAGLPPRHEGGLPGYVEELIAEFSAKGHRVIYVDPSYVDKVPWAHGRKTIGEPTVYKLFNSGSSIQLGRGTTEPDEQVRSGRIFRSLVLRLVRREAPDVVHFQELLGFPVDILPAIKRLGPTVLFTAQDYFAICPTIQLFHEGNFRCDLSTDQLDCDRCCGGALPPRIDRLRQSVPSINRRPRIRAAAEKLVTAFSTPPARREDYVNRRKAFIDILNRLDGVVCMSNLVRDLFVRHGVNPSVITTLRLSRKTYSREPVKRREDFDGRIVELFGSNLSSVAKGKQIVDREFRILADRQIPVRLSLYGSNPHIISPNIRYLGTYGPRDVDRICKDADAGLISSVWYEAFGYIGGEMLTRGLPVIASRIGAMREYVFDGVNGLLFDPDTPGSLADVVTRFATEPGLRSTLFSGVASTVGQFPSFRRHVDDLESLYSTIRGRSELG